MEDLLNLLPDARDLRKCAALMRAEGYYEIAMRLDDTARCVSREERAARANAELEDRECFMQVVSE